MTRTWMPIVGGILSIVAGGMSLMGGLVVAAILSASSSFYYYGSTNLAAAAVWIIFIPYFIICALAIAGGVFALQRRIWGLALAGAIAAFLTLWAWPLGVAAIVLISISKPEFDHIRSVTPPPPSPSPPPPLPPVTP